MGTVHAGRNGFAARSIPANPPRRGSSRSSIRCRRSARPARRSLTANDTKAGCPCPRLMTMAGFPARQRLLADITAGRVDTIVVYKIDRLTRSLADFAKIVEILDARGASFVSV